MEEEGGREFCFTHGQGDCVEVWVWVYFFCACGGGWEGLYTVAHTQSRELCGFGYVCVCVCFCVEERGEG